MRIILKDFYLYLKNIMNVSRKYERSQWQVLIVRTFNISLRFFIEINLWKSIIAFFIDLLLKILYFFARSINRWVKFRIFCNTLSVSSNFINSFLFKPQFIVEDITYRNKACEIYPINTMSVLETFSEWFLKTPL